MDFDVARLAPGWAAGSFLASLPEQQAAELLRGCVPRRFEAGRPLLREGGTDTHVELLIHGFVKVTNVVDGMELLMAIRMPGDIVGELAAVTGRPRMATVTACGPVTAGVITRYAFQRFLHRYPDAAVHMAGIMGERLRWANQRRAEFTALRAEAHLARLLMEFAAVCGKRTAEGVTIGVPLSQTELASMIGVSEATIQKALHRLRADGAISTGYRSITVLDADLLRATGEE